MSVRFLRDVSYKECLERQPFAKERLEGVDPAIVQATWRGVTGAGTATAHQDVVDAVNDTLPMKHAIALLTDEVIAAWALTLHAPEMEEGDSKGVPVLATQARAEHLGRDRSPPRGGHGGHPRHGPGRKHGVAHHPRSCDG